MKPERKLKAQNILFIVTTALVFGVVYNYSFYPHSLAEFLEASTISILIGLIVGILEEFVFINVFQRKAFLIVLIFRATMYSLLISIILSLVLSIESSFIQQITYPEALVEYLLSPLFQRDFLFSLAFLIVVLFLFRIVLIVGKANFFRLLLGLYHKPREISRIFMFVDLNDSTSIAEQLSNKVYSSFIKEYFSDFSDAIIMFGGEIYQFAGDEIIVVWPSSHKEAKCIKCFFKMEEIIEKKRSSYQSKYGVVPRFKAGIHAGKVIVTSVGKQKKEIVYHGDVLNTTSRIEGKCKDLGQKLLISEKSLNIINLSNEFIAELKGKVELKGKTEKLNLYGVRKLTAGNV